MSIDETYLKKLEEEIERLDEENKRLQKLVDRGLVRFSDIPLATKKHWWSLRKTQANTLTFGYFKLKFYAYTCCKTWTFTTPQLLKKKLKGYARDSATVRETYPFILSKFNGVHYPFIDCDSFYEMKQAVDFFNDLGVSYTRIESSCNHFWVIGDVGSRDFGDVYNLVKNIDFGDCQYIKVNNNPKLGFPMRAFKRESDVINGNDYPYVDNLVKSDFCLQEPSVNFERFTRKLKEYFYESGYPSYFGSQVGLGGEVTI